VLHDGAIAEMRTGEGKTLVSPLAAYLNALSGEGVHVVTVNDYLAQRDGEWMGQIHRFLGLSVGLIQSGLQPSERRDAYACDVTYSNNSELGFDYLRDNISERKEDLVMRWPKPFNFAIVDEVDSVLIDEGRNPLLISTQANKDAGRYPAAAEVAALLVADFHYKVNIKDKNVDLTEDGVAAAEFALDTEDLWDDQDPWARFVITAIKAKEFHIRDVHYIVKDGQVQIVDEFTGRVVENRRWSDGIHQAVEAKEGVRIQADAMTVAQITYQSFFKLYPKLSGMTGTAKTEDAEFLKMFKMPVVEVPTNLPNIRQDLPLQLFPTTRGKWDRVRDEVALMYSQGRPVLVGTTSVEQSEHLADLLREWGIPHNVLNARPKYAAREAEIVAQAGRRNAITIATNMAGRGTDIILGGNPEMLAKEIVENRLLGFLTTDAPNVDRDGAPLSQLALSKIKVSPITHAKLARASLAAKYALGMDGVVSDYRQAKATVAAALELAKTEKEADLIEMATGKGAEIITLGPTIALAYLSTLKECQVHCRNEGMEVKHLGGLHVIGTALHESRRIDNQLRGRAARQGDPGSTRFMISLQDEMFRKFNTEWANSIVLKLGLEENVPMEYGSLAKQLLSLQTAAERYYFGIRKSLVEFDEVLEVQRNHVYTLRQSLLLDDSDSNHQRLLQYIQAVADEMVLPHVNPSKPPGAWKINCILDEFHDFISRTSALDSFNTEKQPVNSPYDILSNVTPDMIIKGLRGYDKVDADHHLTLPGLPVAFEGHRTLRFKAGAIKRWMDITLDPASNRGRYKLEVSLLRKYIGDIIIGMYEEKLKGTLVPHYQIEQVERIMAITAVDRYWRDHLVNMNRLRAAVNVRCFGHMNPLEEYKIDGCRFFIAMLSAARRLTVESLLQPWILGDRSENSEYA
jgi:preprotein translocase subunit SecA